MSHDRSTWSESVEYECLVKNLQKLVKNPLYTGLRYRGGGGEGQDSALNFSGFGNVRPWKGTTWYTSGDFNTQKIEWLASHPFPHPWGGVSVIDLLKL